MSKIFRGLFLTFIPFALSAQSGGSLAHRLYLEFELGHPVSSLPDHMTDQAKAAGYGDSPTVSQGGCNDGGINSDPSCYNAPQYPQTHYGSKGLGATVGMYVTHTFSVSASTSYSVLGGARGFQDDATPNGKYLSTSWNVHSYWLMPAWRPIRFVRIGAGPAMYSVHEVTSDKAITRAGLHSELGLELPIGGHVFASAVERFDMGGTSSTTINGYAFKADVNYHAFTMGFGFRM